VRFSCSREQATTSATTSAEELKKGVVPQEPALDSHKSDFRRGIVNKLKNQQQITVSQLSRYYHVEARIPPQAGTVRKALRSVNFGE